MRLSFRVFPVSGGEVIGVINVHHREPHHHTSDEIALLTFVGEQMGGAITSLFLPKRTFGLEEETAEMRRQLKHARSSSGRKASSRCGTTSRKKKLI